MKVKIKYFKCMWGWCADLYVDKDEITKLLRKINKEFNDRYPFLTLTIQLGLTGFTESSFECLAESSGLVASIDSQQLKVNTLEEFKSELTNILSRYGVEVEFEEVGEVKKYLSRGVVSG